MTRQMIYQGPACSFDQLCKAYRLVQTRYVEFGYADPNLSGMRFDEYNFLLDTTTFVSLHEERLVATSTLIPDGPLRLPLAKIFPHEYNYLKSTYGQIAEGSMFACDREYENNGMGAQLALLSNMLAHCWSKKITAIAVIVNPRHVGFYVKVLGFEVLSEERGCSHVQNAPGILLSKTLRGNENQRNLLSTCIRQAAKQKSHNFFRLSAAEIRNLITREPSVFFNMSEQARNVLTKQHATILPAPILSASALPTVKQR